ncbi:hypothetical protein [Maribacter cobaltidurans]|uniref:Uncharacterized protein n=1 Tax=Maribacter cobaltidurans TaxID=1178778 RepID=A0A223VAX2_9FLAO|nr:hypothetical protein [Maribacter cobaltidurans]ASV32417.1 hypothetical protein CJ263_20475 [Maribacter cobaltidurans]GGD75680.1 hypothetical protein GCM10011412_11800 [Maribacter cobaltidurans]
MTKEKGLETVLVLALVSLLVYVKFDLDWLLYVVFILLAIGILSKKLTLLIGKAWFTFSQYFGMVMNYLIMALIFYIVLTPLSFFQKLLGKNQILKKGTSESYFHHRNHTFSLKDIQKPW